MVNDKLIQTATEVAEQDGIETGVVRGGSSEDPNREATEDESTTGDGQREN